jgi:hypothetical protein
MFFLLRMAFWLGVVLILLPSGTAQRSTTGSDIDASEAISAASATVSDLKGFCTRQPEACTVGSQVASAIGSRAQAGAKMLYDMLSEALASHETGSVSSGRRSGAPPSAEKSAPERSSQSTLTPNDLAPAWRGPLPRKDPRRAA